MKISIFAAFLLCVLFCRAQENQSTKTYYVKGDLSPTALYGIRVNHLDSANYIRKVASEKNNENLYDVTEYYLDKTVKRIGNSLTNGFSPKYSGTVISYFKNGNKASEELYITGMRKGVATYYYPNKQIKKQVDFGKELGKYSETVLELNDSLGKRFLDDSGSGAFKITEDNGELIEGYYLEGRKDRTWKTIHPKTNETYFDEYSDGEYLRGKTVDSVGKIIEYDKLEALPEFKGGIKAFGAFLSSNLRYPKAAQKNKTQGRVFLSLLSKKTDL